MASFVHVTDEKHVAAIKRGGIKPSRLHLPDDVSGVFCMPVTGEFAATHQWVRELMRGGVRVPVGIYFRLADAQPVLFGYYHEEYRTGTAAEAVGAFLGLEDRLGFQVVVTGKVSPKNITSVRSVPALGWRYSPDAKGRKPCLCRVCVRKGEFGSRRMLERKADEILARYRNAATSDDRVQAFDDLSELVAEHKLRLPGWQQLQDDPAIQAAIAEYEKWASED